MCHAVVQRLEPGFRQGAVVVELERLPRLARSGEPVGFACRLERRDGHRMGSDVVGMRVAAGLVVGDHHVRTESADQRHEPFGRLLQRSDGEAAVWQRFAGGGQPGVDEAQELLADAEDVAGGRHLRAADPGEVAAQFGPVHGGVEHGAALAAGAGDHEDVHALGGVFGQCRGALARFVVGVGVHAHQSQRFFSGNAQVHADLLSVQSARRRRNVVVVDDGVPVSIARWKTCGMPS